MFYANFTPTGEVTGITNEENKLLQQVEITLELYQKFSDGIENFADYRVIKIKDYILERKNSEYAYGNIFTVVKTKEKKLNCIYILQDPKNKVFKITHTFPKGKFVANDLTKRFYVTKENNANKLLTTLECNNKDFAEDTYVFDSKYYEDVSIITSPDIEDYFHYVGEDIG